MKPHSINCRTVRDLLPLHVGGDLDRARIELVDRHLHACLPCYREFRALAAMRGRLGVLADVPLPRGALDGFTDEVMARVALVEAGEDRGPAAPPPDARQGVLLRRLAAAAAVVLVVSLGVIAIAEREQRSLPEPEEPAYVAEGDAVPWPGEESSLSRAFGPLGTNAVLNSVPVTYTPPATPSFGDAPIPLHGQPILPQLLAPEPPQPDPERRLRTRDDG